MKKYHEGFILDFKVVILKVFFWLYWYLDFLFVVWGLTYVTDQRLILVHPNNHLNLRVFLSIWSSNHAEYWRHSRHWQMGVWVTLQVIEYLVLIWNWCLFLNCKQSCIQQGIVARFFNNLAHEMGLLETWTGKKTRRNINSLPRAARSQCVQICFYASRQTDKWN